MNYISEIFQRANIDSICDFLQYGTECSGHSAKSYMEQLKEAEESVSDLLMQKFPDEAEYDEVFDKVTDYVTVCQDIYTKVGLQCSFAIIMELLKSVDRNGV